jgi:hypothetical protein
MSGHNALERLHGAHLVLRQANIRTLDEYRTATTPMASGPAGPR